MKLSIKGCAIASALLWAGAILVGGLIHLAVPSYGTGFLDFASSIYPGFHGGSSFGDILLGTAYGLVDAGIGGLVFAWLYNVFAGPAA